LFLRLAKTQQADFSLPKNALCRSIRHVYGAPRDTLSALARNGERIFTTRKNGRSYAPYCAFGLLRKSFTRTALPSERGTSPGALTVTSQLTPIKDLM
jgi:hypothetical protein